MKYGLIGEKLGHSFSKEIHESFAPYEYSLQELAKTEVDDFLEKKNFNAINITIPYKQTVIPHLTYIDEKAKSIGAVNTVVNKNGLLFGYNTDFDGMRMLLQRNDIELDGRKVLILGTGGTSKTARAVATHLGAKEIVVVSRNGEDNYGNIKALHPDAQVIINTTPCGMYPNIGTQAITLDGFDKLEGVCDVVYNPLKTELIIEAENRGIKCCGGLFMLVAQAVYASEIFLETKYDDTVFEKAYNHILRQKQNIVLVGMPGCGKTTFGRIISKELGLRFVDTDDLIVKKEGREISEIIPTEGEKYFRDVESSVVEEISLKNGYVIATGGGAILRPENVKNLRRNGRIIFLNRNIDDIVPTESRPLSSNREDLQKRFDERMPIYKSIADTEIKVEGSIESVAQRIIRCL